MAQYRKWLSSVDKPARYTGGEFNIIQKDPNGKLRFALAFPDTYEIGMSHIGSKIIYDILNKRDDTYCERVYALWPDAEKKLKESGQKLFALETGDELLCFDVIGFSLLYEMTYTNVLNVLELAGIPVHASERTENMPIIIAGGPCTVNSEPVAPFFDAILIGDGESAVLELAETVIEAKKKGLTRDAIIDNISKIEGFYIPSKYTVDYSLDGTIKRISGNPEKINRRIEKELEPLPYPDKPLVPNTGIVHDRAAVELFRGCTRGCRFCQAGYIYRPVRERSVETLVEQACKIIQSTGYDEISLTSLSSGDYSRLEELIDILVDKFKEKNVSLSLPSLRIDSYLQSYAEGTSSVRKGGLTFAPEAGTQRMRDIINKGVTEDDLITSVADAFQAGYSNVKLYFMIGLPGETDEDLDGIVDLAKKVVEQYYKLPKEKRHMAPSVTVSVSPFVPKPFTPFQWEAQDTLETIREKQEYLREKLKKQKRIKFITHNAQLSFMEAVFARGDRRLAKVIESAWRTGAKFDGWDEYFNFDIWTKAFSECGIEPAFYANRERSTDEILPYEHIDIGVTKKYLLSEREKAYSRILTPDCREGCRGCGIAICGVNK